MKQPAIFRFSPCRFSPCWTVARWLGTHLFLKPWTIFAMFTNFPLCGNSFFLKPRKPPFSNVARETGRCHWFSYNMWSAGTGHAVQVWYLLSFDGPWWGSSVHLIHLGTTVTAIYRVDLTTEGPPPLVLFRFRRPSVFFSCPVKVCPLWARCVCVGICSFPLLLRSPPRVRVT